MKNYKPSKSSTLTDKIAGLFVIPDGIDCGGKGTAVLGLREWATENGLRVFDLGKHQEDYGHTWPLTEELAAILDTAETVVADETPAHWVPEFRKHYDVLVCCEPPRAGTGWDLRYGMLQNLGKYSARETAVVFSAYRIPWYGEVIEPWLRSGGAVFQERGVSTSFRYQPVQAQLRGENLPFEYIEGLDGNQRALQTPPQLLLKMLCEPHEAARRVAVRRDKQDRCDFEDLKKMIPLDKAYREPWLENYFGRLGSTVVAIETTGLQVADTKALVRKKWVEFLEQYEPGTAPPGEQELPFTD